MTFKQIRDFFSAKAKGLLARLKPERIQGLTIPAETPMTLERIRNRAEESGFELLYAPVAIRKVYRRGDFGAAMDDACAKVRAIAAEHGHAPKVTVEGGCLTLTLGIEIPNLLSEADFDVADALEAELDDAGSDAAAGGPNAGPGRKAD